MFYFVYTRKILDSRSESGEVVWVWSGCGSLLKVEVTINEDSLDLL